MESINRTAPPLTGRSLHEKFVLMSDPNGSRTAASQTGVSSATRSPRNWKALWLVSAPANRPNQAIAIVLGMAALIALVDYYAGFWISMQLFYLLPILMAVAWLGWRIAGLIALLCVVARVVGDAAAGIFVPVKLLPALWNPLAELAVSWFVVWVFHTLISLQHELEARVQQRTASLEQAVAARDQLQKQLFEVGRQERSTIGHELHDGLGQHLTATSIAANVLASRLASSAHPDAECARKVVELVQEGIAQTRQIARGLLLSAVKPDELATELEELADTIGQEHGIACRFTRRGTVAGINIATSSHLFYIAQEAVRNSLKHAKAEQISITLAIDDTTLNLEVVDDGIGLPALDFDHRGMGLRILHHRCELIGAELTIESKTGRGTRIDCRVPLPKPAAVPS